MSERLFARLAARLRSEAVVLASVLRTRGATPRKAGARLLAGAQDFEGSIGGGLAEARVLAAARALLENGGGEGATLEIDLSGGPDSAGVCGGRMWLALRRWQGEADRARAQAVAEALASGTPVRLEPGDLGDEDASQEVAPDPRLLIVGGGHCGFALYQLAAFLDFDLWVFDAEHGPAEAARFPLATHLGGDHARIARALETARPVHAVLLNRDFHADVATLRALAPAPPRFISMMGSARRIAQVRAAVPGFDQHFAHLRAPVGLDIGAQTPQEIAVSILAQVVADRNS